MTATAIMLAFLVILATTIALAATLTIIMTVASTTITMMVQLADNHALAINLLIDLHRLFILRLFVTTITERKIFR